MKAEFWLGNRFGRKTRFLWIAGAVAVGIAAMGGVVMVLWNWLMPTLFTGSGPIDYWRAVGLLLLCKLLFGGGGRHWHGRHRHLENMTPDEREHFKQHFKSRWGRRFGLADGDGPAVRPSQPASVPAVASGTGPQDHLRDPW